MCIKIFFSLLFSGIMIQFFKIYNVIHNLNLLKNFKKYFFIIFNQMYFQKSKSNLKYIQHTGYHKLAHSTKTIRFFPEFDRNLKLYSKLHSFMKINETLCPNEQEEKIHKFGISFYDEIISNITFHHEKLDKEILFLFNPFILIFNSIKFIISFLLNFFDFKFSARSVNLFSFFITLFIFLIGYIKIYYLFIV